MGDSIIWAAYASAIATLAAPGGLGLTSSQTFYINKQNAYAIPVVGTGTVNQLYQNWNVYQFASTVPSNDIAVLTDSGQNYDTAYGVYMDNVVIQVPVDPAVQAQLNATVVKIDALRQSIQDSKRKAINAFMTDCPNGVDPFTGQVTTLAEYAALYYPEIANGAKSLATLEGVRFELENTISGGQQLARLKSWRDALTNGTRTDTNKPGYNMPVLQTDQSVVVSVANGSVLANNQPTSYVPGWSIGGSFNTVARNWINTFPSEYPLNRAKYDAGKSVYSTLTIDTTKNNWKQFGHSSSTQSTGSSGWVFWSKKSTTTNTWDRYAIRINETSFKKGISVAVWGIGTFPIQMSQWYQGNPKTTWPVLVASAKPKVRDEVTRQITSVVMGYGVETTFILEKTAFDSFVGAVSTAKSSRGSLSVFGSLYGTSDGDHSSTYEPWENVKTFSENNTIVLRAQHGKVPMILGTTVTRITG